MLTALILLAAIDAAPLATRPAPVALVGRAETTTTRTLSDVARERKLGVKPNGSGTFSVTGATGMPVLVPSLVEPSEAAVMPPPHGVSASEASTGWYIYGPGGTRTYYYYSQAPSHQHSAAHAHAPAASTPAHAAAGHSSRKH